MKKDVKEITKQLEQGVKNVFESGKYEEYLSFEQTIKTMIHEISHAVLHDKENGSEKDADNNTREVQAESVAYVVCQMLGIDSSEYSFGYVAGWSKDRTVKELSASLDVIRKTATDLTSQIYAA